jgi:hypothetical protein
MAAYRVMAVHIGMPLTGPISRGIPWDFYLGTYFPRFSADPLLLPREPGIPGEPEEPGGIPSGAKILRLGFLAEKRRAEETQSRRDAEPQRRRAAET